MDIHTAPFLQLRAVGRLLTCAALLAAVVVLAAGCGGGGGDGGDGDGDGSGKVDIAEGRKLFKQKCGVCHSLEDAGTAGVQGPPLDPLQPDYERTLFQIENGGGGMPAKIYEGEQAETVARYVVEVAGKPGN